MNIRPTAAAVAVLGVTLVGCGNSDSGGSKADAGRSGTPAATKSADSGDAKKDAGIPAAPTGTERAALLSALKAIDPALVADEDKAIGNARNQCSDIKTDNDPARTAKARFSIPDHKVVRDLESRKIDVAVSTALCLQG
jgi:hypothetical protein